MKRRSTHWGAKRSSGLLSKPQTGASFRDSSSGSGDVETAALETPTGSSSSLATGGTTSVNAKEMAKLSEADRRVTRPIRLLQENVMMELYQEQLRMPSPVRQSNNPSERARRATIATATVPTSNNNNRDTRDGSGRASISHTGYRRPTIILYEEEPSVASFDMAPLAGALPPSTAAAPSSACRPFVEVEQEPRVRSSTSSRASAPVVLVDTLVANAVTAAANGAMEGFDTAQQRECQICFDKMDALQAHVCVSCSGSFCSTCMQWYVEFKILDGEVSRKKLVCPAPHCVRPLPEDLIEAFASQETFAKYQSFLKSQKTGVRFCPRAGCCAIIDEPLFCRDRKVKCAECNTESCMRCGGDYHRTRLCRRVDKRYGRWKRNHNVRACPTCRTDIEKQGGCAHMKCFQCDQEFCWACLRAWDDHDETLCIPLAFYHSKSRKYGCWAPLRFVTKSVVLSVASVVVVAGAGVAIVVLPPVIGYHLVRDSYRRKKHQHRSYMIQTSESVPL
ncbi:Ring finger protein [Globisporangium polare]